MNGFNSMTYSGDYLMHYGVKGQEWGKRRYQNEDGSYKPGAEGRYAQSNRVKAAKQQTGNSSSKSDDDDEKKTTVAAGGSSSSPKVIEPDDEDEDEDEKPNGIARLRAQQAAKEAEEAKNKQAAASSNTKAETTEEQKKGSGGKKKGSGGKKKGSGGKKKAATNKNAEAAKQKAQHDAMIKSLQDRMSGATDALLNKYRSESTDKDDIVSKAWSGVKDLIADSSLSSVDYNVVANSAWEDILSKVYGRTSK